MSGNKYLTGGLFDQRGKPQPLRESAKSKQIVTPEKRIQAAFIAWRNINKGQHSILNSIFAVPNGIWAQNIKVANANVRLGMTAGIPDIICLAPSVDGQYHGLLIEFKTLDLKRSVPSDEQKYFIEFFAGLGYRTEICRQWEDAADLIIDYLNLNIRKPFRRT